MKGEMGMNADVLQGQPKFRGMWDRYCRGADAIVYASVYLLRVIGLMRC